MLNYEVQKTEIVSDVDKEKRVFIINNNTNKNFYYCIKIVNYYLMTTRTSITIIFHNDYES
jgi:hypothetical protein